VNTGSNLPVVTVPCSECTLTLFDFEMTFSGKQWRFGKCRESDSGTPQGNKKARRTGQDTCMPAETVAVCMYVFIGRETDCG
jgi:hypothetical protein